MALRASAGVMTTDSEVYQLCSVAQLVVTIYTGKRYDTGDLANPLSDQHR